MILRANFILNSEITFFFFISPSHLLTFSPSHPLTLSPSKIIVFWFVFFDDKVVDDEVLALHGVLAHVVFQ